MMIEWIGFFLLVIGLLFFTVGNVGVVRYEDVYLRLQCASKSLTFGFCSIVLAAGILSEDPSTLVKACVAVAFQFITAPISAHVIAHAAVKRRLRPAHLHAEEDIPETTTQDEVEKPKVDELASGGGAAPAAGG
ncbi:MAG: monovalent cation/H(+) antiporter subunit G [Sumerlaeia bacterium]